jgi:hypothetical protein
MLSSLVSMDGTDLRGSRRIARREERLEGKLAVVVPPDSALGATISRDTFDMYTF